MAMDNVSCASGLNAPREIPGATKRFRISWADSTSVRLVDLLFVLYPNKSRILMGGISSII